MHTPARQTQAKADGLQKEQALAAAQQKINELEVSKAQSARNLLCVAWRRHGGDDNCSVRCRCT